MNKQGRETVVWVCLFTPIAALLAWMTWLSHGPWSPAWRFVALAIAAHIPYGALLLLARRRASFVAPAAILAAGLGLRLLLAAAQPVFSDDVYRYAWDGRVTLLGMDPYALPPAAPELARLRDDDWARINNSDMRTPYPPVAQLYFAAVASLGPGIGGFKIASAFADTGVALLVFLIAGGRLFRLRLAPDDAPSRDAAWSAAAYALCPLACLESGMSGHLEPLALALVLAAIAALRSSDRIRATLLGALSFAAAVGVKLMPALLLPALSGRRRLAWAAAGAMTLGVLSLSYSLFGGASFESADAMLRRWEGNGSVFRVVDWVSTEALTALLGASGPEDIVHLSWMDGPARALEGTFFSLHKDAPADPARPGAFALGDIALAISKVIAALAVLAVAARAFALRFDAARAGLWITGALTLCTPTLHPWYAIWVLAFAATTRAWWWLVLVAALPLSYLSLEEWWTRGTWTQPGWVAFAEYLPFAAAGVVAVFAGRKRAKR